MAFSMSGGGASHPQINVTPLIDVLLTLIVMFMLVVGDGSGIWGEGADSSASNGSSV
jgi:hypothetical protein